VRAALDFPSGRDVVDLDSFRTSENGLIGFYRFFREQQRAGDPLPSLPNGSYSLRLAVEAGGVYTPVMEANVQRACP
jgi:hypothetical protein